jgi:hypothetical protein
MLSRPSGHKHHAILSRFGVVSESFAQQTRCSEPGENAPVCNQRSAAAGSLIWSVRRKSMQSTATLSREGFTEWPRVSRRQVERKEASRRQTLRQHSAASDGFE